MSETVLEVRDLVVDYGRRRAVDGVGFSLPPGTALGVVGESGCGKTSLARAVLQLIDYTGSVRLLGDELSALRPADLRRARRNMQAVFQDPLASLSPHLNVAQILEEPLRVHCATMDKAGRREKVRAMLDRVGIDREMLAARPHELSGGQCQRVAIARAAITEPQLLVCDEPVSALDTSIRGQVLGLLEALKRDFGIGLLFIAHDMTAVRYLCDSVLVMHGGRVVENAPRERIFNAPEHPYTRSLLDAVLPPDPQRQPPVDPLT